MQNSIRCACGNYLDTDAHQPGDRVQCPTCNKVFLIGGLAVATFSVPNEMAFTVEELLADPSIEKSSRSVGLATHLFRAIVFCVPLAMLGSRLFCCQPTADADQTEVIGVAIVLIAIAIFAIWYFCFGATVCTRSEAALRHVTGPLSKACDAFKCKTGFWPERLEDLLKQHNQDAAYVDDMDALIDPWGNPYQYDAEGPMNHGERPDIWCESPETRSKVGNW
jgi:hypothetical protein